MTHFLYRTGTSLAHGNQRVLAVTVILAFLMLTFGAPDAKGDGQNDGPFVRVMTQNMDEGTNFQELVAAHTPGEFVAAVTTTYNNILATKPAERAAAMAREIAKQRPDLVALQEASILRTGTGGPATTVKSDLLQLLVEALTGLGQHYATVAVVPGLDAQAPSLFGFDVRLTTQDAILMRTDLPPNDFKFSNLQIQRYGTNLTVPTAVGPITVARGWASIDVKRRGREFRFVTTHLDAIAPPVSLAQARELVLTAGNTMLPVIFAGDFNATADSSLDPTFPTYQAVIDAGFSDAWQAKRAPEPGFTCCQLPDLHNAMSLLNHRIDLILLRGAFGIADVNLIGNQPADRTFSGLWPSDHAGVVAKLTLPRGSADDD
jgi:endonuclease/exonuclease/phosphatase family metal-dependent hydrolase